MGDGVFAVVGRTDMPVSSKKEMRLINETKDKTNDSQGTDRGAVAVHFGGNRDRSVFTHALR